MKLDSKQIRLILAPIYQKACMDEKVNMMEITTLLDYMRVIFENNYAFEAWSNIRIDRSKYDHEHYISYLRELRDEYYKKITEWVVEEIKETAEKDQEQGFDAWQREYGHALAWWREQIYNELCKRSLPFSTQQKKIIARYKKLNAFILDNKWVEAYPYYCELAENPLLSDLTRSNLYVIAGEIQLFWTTDYREAFNLFNKAKELFAENSRVEKAFGEYYNRRGEFEKAKNYFLSAISMRPNDIDNYLEIGNTYRDEKNPEAAEQWYNDALNINFLETTSYSKFILLNDTAEELKAKAAEVKSLVDKVIMMEPADTGSNTLYNFLRDTAYAYLTVKDYKNAAEYYKRAMKCNEQLTSAKIDLGYTYTYAKKIDEALSWFNASLKKSEEWNFDSHWGLAYLYEEMGAEHYEKAIAEYRLCMKSRPESADKCLNAIGVLQYKQKDYGQSIKFYDQAIVINPKEVVYYENKYDALQKTHAKPEAVQSVLTNIISVDSSNAEAYNKRGVFFYEHKEYDKAIEDYTKAISINSSVSIYYENRGLAWLARKDYSKTQVDYEKALELGRSDSLLNALGIVYYRTSQYQKAIKAYSDAIELNPQVAVYYENLGLAYENSGNDEMAVQSYKLAIEHEKKKGTYLNRLGYHYYKKSDTDPGAMVNAITYYSQALEKEPANFLYLENLALAYETVDPLKAEQLYEQLVEKEKKNVFARFRLAVLKIKAGVFDETVYKLLQQVIKADPSNVEYLNYLAYYYEKTQKDEEALKIYYECLKYSPDDDYFNNKTGILLFYRGTPADIQEAVKHYKKAIDKNGQLPVYWQNLGLAYEHLGDYKQAEEIYLKSINLDNKNAENFNQFGVFYNDKMKDYPKAIEYYKKAIEIDSSKALFYTNLAYAYELMNDDKSASEAYQMANSIQVPRYTDRSRLEKALP